MSKPSQRSPERKLQVVLSVLRGEVSVAAASNAASSTGVCAAASAIARACWGVIAPSANASAVSGRSASRSANCTSRLAPPRDCFRPLRNTSAACAPLSRRASAATVSARTPASRASQRPTSPRRSSSRSPPSARNPATPQPARPAAPRDAPMLTHRHEAPDGPQQQVPSYLWSLRRPQSPSAHPSLPRRRSGGRRRQDSLPCEQPTDAPAAHHRRHQEHQPQLESGLRRQGQPDMQPRKVDHSERSNRWGSRECRQRRPSEAGSVRLAGGLLGPRVAAGSGGPPRAAPSVRQDGCRIARRL